MELDIDYQFNLFGIKSNASEAQMAYNLNIYLDTFFQREKNDLDIFFKDLNSLLYFPIFKYYDEEKDEEWFLLKNSGTFEFNNSSKTTEDLFSNDTDTNLINKFILPEKKEFNFILKIDLIENKERQNEILRTIKNIPIVTTAYSIEFSKLKSKQNLIF